MTFEEINIVCKGYEIRKAREKEVERIIAATLINVYRGDHAPYELEEIFPLCIDKERAKNKLLTKEEYLKTQEIISKVKWQDQN
jgi:hypothetical protein